MSSSNVKVFVYVAVVLLVGALLGMAVLKFNTANNAADIDTRTQAEKLQALENSPGVTTPAARSFIRNEKARLNDTQQAEDAVMGE
ncbi:MAG: hypothetical protein HYX78_11875 [Armatimonadetes bacterium]|nr:hypothetical protein [Armatimonadota bacterium]